MPHRQHRAERPPEEITAASVNPLVGEDGLDHVVPQRKKPARHVYPRTKGSEHEGLRLVRRKDEYIVVVVGCLGQRS